MEWVWLSNMLLLERPLGSGQRQVGLDRGCLGLPKLTNARFKYALWFIKKNENTMRADSLARKLQNNNLTDFWKEVKVLNNKKTPLPSDIEVSSPDKIAELWRRHYSNLFHCVKKVIVRIEHESTGLHTYMIVRSTDINDAIHMLDNNKACGMDCITAEHLKNASYRLSPLLAMCFTGLMVHGVLLYSIRSVLLVPVLSQSW